MEEKEFMALYQKYIKGECTPEEQLWLQRWYLEEAKQRPSEDLPPVDYEKAKASIWANIASPTGVTGQGRTIRLSTYISAAAILIVIAMAYYFIPPKVLAPQPGLASIIKDVAPGGNNAILTLPNGQRIDLKKASTGQIANNLNLYIHKKDEGELVFTGSTISKSATISTPKGGQFIVQLPDGSRVWLNAASSLTFPANFKGMASRKVELTGEGYFEVAKVAKQPFIVKTSTQEVQVLGTHFNVNSYTDEPSVVTTLLEGSVRVFSPLSKVSKTLSPGQMAKHQDRSIIIEKAPLYATAWKDGKFKFNEEDLPTILRQVSRWYDIEIEYQGKIPTKTFSGGIPRTTTLSTVLAILKTSNIEFELESVNGGKKLTVKTQL